MRSALSRLAHDRTPRLRPPCRRRSSVGRRCLPAYCSGIPCWLVASPFWCSIPSKRGEQKREEAGPWCPGGQYKARNPAVLRTGLLSAVLHHFGEFRMACKSVSVVGKPSRLSSKSAVLKSYSITTLDFLIFPEWLVNIDIKNIIFRTTLDKLAFDDKEGNQSTVPINCFDPIKGFIKPVHVHTSGLRSVTTYSCSDISTMRQRSFFRRRGPFTKMKSSHSLPLRS